MVNENLGIDIKIDGDGDIIWNYKDDFVLVDDINNLTQAVINRLKTGFDELLLHPLYGSGIPLIIGRNSITDTISLVRQSVRESLYQEPRIQQIDNITIQYDTVDSIKIWITILPIDSVEKLNIVYPLFLG